jgi:hypothetical protein
VSSFFHKKKKNQKSTSSRNKDRSKPKSLAKSFQPTAALTSTAPHNPYKILLLLNIIILDRLIQKKKGKQKWSIVKSVTQ